MNKSGNTYSYKSSLGFFSWKYLDWDSKLLNRNAAKIISLNSSKLSEKKIRIIIQKLKENLVRSRIDYATYRLKASDFLTIHSLEKEGFNLVDGLINLKLDIAKIVEARPKEVREAEKRDLQYLQELASGSFSETRFYNDFKLEKKYADKIYEEWIKNSLFGKSADKVLVWVEKNKVSGFIAIKKSGNIVLVAVNKKARGKKIGRKLVKTAISYFFKWHLKESTIETQMTNISALRAYQACGYKITDSQLTFRWMRNEN